MTLLFFLDIEKLTIEKRSYPHTPEALYRHFLETTPRDLLHRAETYGCTDCFQPDQSRADENYPPLQSSPPGKVFECYNYSSVVTRSDSEFGNQVDYLEWD